MTDDEKLERINSALGYWSLIDFLTQDSTPETDAFANIFCSSTNANSKSSPISISRRFEYELEENADETVLSLVESNIENACRKRIGSLNKKKTRTKKETHDLNLLNDAIDNSSLPEPAAIDIFLGIIPREPVIFGLEKKIGKTIHISHKRAELETDDLVSALIHLNKSGAIAGIEMSPAIWLLTHGLPDEDNLLSAYEKDVEDFSREHIKKLEEQPITVDDLRTIVNDLLPATLRNSIGAFLKKHPTYKTEPDSNPIYRTIVSYQAFDNPDRKPLSTTLHSSFYSKDIKALFDTIERDSNLKSLSRGQLKLVLSYLEGGLENHSERDARRLDIQDDTDDRSRASSFYRAALAFEHTPLGRWPSKYGLSLMQQIAVNLVAGRDPIHIGAAADTPIPDVMSVNGPPGTGKTTLLKDIIAANIVEKARLLSSYDQPDEAFSKIQGVDEYVRYTETAYHLNDPRISDLGIIVCSSNNTAVENISEELPQGKALLNGLEDEEKDTFCEKALFQGFSDDEQNLFEMSWKIERGENGSKSNNERKAVPDLYFSRIACKQFNIPEKADAPLNMLISARLGKKDNIGSFRDTTLSEIAFASNNVSRQECLERFRRSSEAFRKQYKRVESLMKHYEEKQSDILRCQKALEKACHELKRDNDTFLDMKGVSENAERRLKDDLSSSIHRLINLDGMDDRLDGYLGQIKSIDDLRSLEDRIKEELSDYTSDLEALEKRVESLGQSLASRGLLNLIIIPKQERDLLFANKELVLLKEKNASKDRLYRFKLELTKELKKLEIYKKEARGAKEDANKAEKAYIKAKKAVDSKQDELNQSLEACSWDVTPNLINSVIGADADQDKLHDAHLFTPAAAVPNDGELRYERDKLFLRALQVTRDFILSSSCMASNLRLLNAYWGAAVEKANGTGKGRIRFSEGDAQKIVPALFQTLNILTPVISTTFASAGRLLRDIPIANSAHAPLGLCIIDEAGQAVPQAAVGVLSRCNKALVVGDPCQIEPVVNSEVKLFTELLGRKIDFPFKNCNSSVQEFADATNTIGHYRDNNTELLGRKIDFPFKNCNSSVQEFADATNTIGHYRDNNKDEGGKKWIGCPLVVHRRCISPMFDISNRISYGNSMLNETVKLDPNRDKERLQSFYCESSQWFNVSGHENGKKDHYVAAQGERAREIVLSAFAKKPKNVDIPSLYIISPFSTVAKGMRNALENHRPDSVDKKAWDNFLKNNIGTVHKFQGKEAQEVIFMLGCDDPTEGAVNWVSSNIVNVAASRAKQRLYVIADCRVWDTNEYVSMMKQIYDTYWISSYKNAKANNWEGIEEVWHALPGTESLPTTTNDALNGTEDICYDTAHFIRNVHPSIMQLGLSEDVCKCFGFTDEQMIDSAFSAYADNEESFNNPILYNIKMGMLLYELFDIGNRIDNGEQVDWSFCGITFCRAAELLLQRTLLPSIKSIEPEIAIMRNQKKNDKTELSLGQYYHALCNTNNVITCGMAAGYQCGESADNLETTIDGKTPRDPEWWAKFGKNLAKLASERNDVSHAGRNATPDIKKLLARLFESHIRPEDQGKHVALFNEDSTLEIARKGIGSDSYSRIKRELESKLAKKAGPPKEEESPHTEPPTQTDHDDGPSSVTLPEHQNDHDANQSNEPLKNVFKTWQEELSKTGEIPTSLQIDTAEVNKFLISMGYMERPASGRDAHRPMFTEKAFAKWGTTNISNSFSETYKNHSPKYTLAGFKAVLNFYAECKGINDRIE